MFVLAAPASRFCAHIEGGSGPARFGARLARVRALERGAARGGRAMRREERARARSARDDRSKRAGRAATSGRREGSVLVLPREKLAQHVVRSDEDADGGERQRAHQQPQLSEEAGVHRGTPTRVECQARRVSPIREKDGAPTLHLLFSAQPELRLLFSAQPLTQPSILRPARTPPSILNPTRTQPSILNPARTPPSILNPARTAPLNPHQEQRGMGVEFKGGL